LFDHIHVGKSKAKTRSNQTLPKIYNLFAMISSQSSDDLQIVHVSKRQKMNIISDSESDAGKANLSANNRYK
jgi:hypothetical protein